VSDTRSVPPMGGDQPAVLLVVLLVVVLGLIELIGRPPVLPALGGHVGVG
jgi:hypothetical protein